MSSGPTNAALPAGVVVTVPAFREERLIGRTLASIPDGVERIIVVDDASDDDTVARVEEAAARDARIELVRHQTNRGVGGAIKSGYRAFLDGAGEICVVMAGDAQMDPADLPRLVEPVAAGRADYAKGNRLADPEVSRVMPRHRYWGIRGLNALTRIASGYGVIADAQCGYTAINRAVLHRLEVDAVYERYGVPNDLLIRLNEARARLVEVPVRPVYGEEVSGIRLGPLIPRLLALLGGGFLRRLRRAGPRLFVVGYALGAIALTAVPALMLFSTTRVLAIGFLTGAFLLFLLAREADRRTQAVLLVAP